MAIYWPTPGFTERTFKLCVLTRWDFNFCIRSSTLRSILATSVILSEHCVSFLGHISTRQVQTSYGCCIREQDVAHGTTGDLRETTDMFPSSAKIDFFSYAKYSETIISVFSECYLRIPVLATMTHCEDHSVQKSFSLSLNASQPTSCSLR